MIEKLGHYKIVSELGRGGMGVVYKAYEESLNRYVAIKVLGEHLSHDENFVKRFVREARGRRRAVASERHPDLLHRPRGLSAPNSQGPDERHYFVMEFVEGRSVHDVLEQDGALDPMRAARIVQQAASGLAVAHDQGLVHRDIKPANLLVTKDERVKIADFGLALAPTDGATRLTATNSLMGTPGYLSPEQCCGEPAGPRSDIYSLGMTFYEMLTGSMPFKGESPLAVLRQILDEEPPSLLQIDPDLDPRIAGVVERMVAKEPNDRYQTCHQLVADLNEILGTKAAAVPTAGAARAAALPPLPGAPSSTSARTQAKVTGRPEDAPTQAAPAPPPPPGSGRLTGARAAATAGAIPPVPPAAQPVAAAAAAPPALVAPAVVAAGAAAAKSGKGGRLLLIGVMAVMLVIAVSAAGLYFAVPMLKDAPFLRDAPFLKDASFLKGGSDKATAGSEPVATENAAATQPPSGVAANESDEGTFEIQSDATDEPRSDESSLDGGAGKTEAATGDSAGLTRSLAAPSAPRNRSESAGSNAIAEQAAAPAPRRRAVRPSARTRASRWSRWASRCSPAPPNNRSRPSSVVTASTSTTSAAFSSCATPVARRGSRPRLCSAWSPVAASTCWC